MSRESAHRAGPPPPGGYVPADAAEPQVVTAVDAVEAANYVSSRRSLARPDAEQPQSPCGIRLVGPFRPAAQVGADVRCVSAAGEDEAGARSLPAVATEGVETAEVSVLQISRPPTGLGVLRLPG